ncbi:MAG TPA: hypothetical protein VF521_12545, partial [Pyrinomonadaceae bacterium]
MNIKKILTCVLAAAALATAAGAQTKKTTQTASATTTAPAAAEREAAAPFDQKRFDAMRAEGFDALYNLDYESARKRFRDITVAFPTHPAGYELLAAGLWLKTLNETRRLQASLYNNEGFYKEKDDRVDPKVQAEFRELTRKTKELCEARL